MSYDIYLAPLNGESTKPFGFFYAQAVKVTGYTKLAQVFLYHLLTPAGSHPSGAVKGTALPDLMGSTVSDALEAQTLITLAVQDALEQVQSRPRALGESLSLTNAEVSNFTLDDNGNADLVLRLTAQDGKTITIALPLNTESPTGLSAAKIAAYGTSIEGL